jgi:hypothetical protein
MLETSQGFFLKNAALATLRTPSFIEPLTDAIRGQPSVQCNRWKVQ